MYPLKFEPILKQTLWGGDKIIAFMNLSVKRITLVLAQSFPC